MAVVFTDAEYGRIARALGWPPQRAFRLPYYVSCLGPAQPFVLDARLALLDEATKTTALAMADKIILRTEEARDALFDLVPSVTRAGEVQKDEAKGYRDSVRVVGDMRAELARTVDFHVNPELDESGQVRAIG